MLRNPSTRTRRCCPSRTRTRGSDGTKPLHSRSPKSGVENSGKKSPVSFRWSGWSVGLLRWTPACFFNSYNLVTYIYILSCHTKVLPRRSCSSSCTPRPQIAPLHTAFAMGWERHLEQSPVSARHSRLRHRRFLSQPFPLSAVCVHAGTHLFARPERFRIAPTNHRFYFSPQGRMLAVWSGTPSQVKPAKPAARWL